MPAFELISYFASGEATWEEFLYWEGPGFAGAMRALLAISDDRIGLLGQGARLARLRVTCLQETGSSVESGASGTQPDSPACEPWTGLLVRLEGTLPGGTQDTFGVRLLRCFPAAWLPEPGGKSLLTNPLALRSFANWADALRQNRVCIQSHDWKQPRYPVQAVGWFGVVDAGTEGLPLNPDNLDPMANYVCLNIPKNVLITLQDPNTGKRSQVGVHGVRFAGSSSGRAPQINGTRRLIDSGPGYVIVNGQLPLTGSFAYRGTVQLKTLAYVPILQAIPEGAAEKKVGLRRIRTTHEEITVPALKELPDVVIPPEIPTEPVILPVEPPPPPPPPPLVYIPPPDPSTVGPPYPPLLVCSNVADLFSVDFEGYYPGETPASNPIGIYQLVNQNNTYVVCLSGTDIRMNQATGIPDDVLAGLIIPGVFGTAVTEAIRFHVPPGANLILSGHSLGGMVCNNVAGILQLRGYRIYRVITCGSAKNAPAYSGIIYNRFTTTNDLVPLVPILGFLLFLLDATDQIEISNFPYGEGIIDSHLNYYHLDSLKRYTPWGDFIGQVPAQQMFLRLIVRLPVPVG